MKTIRNIFFAVACIVLSANLGMAITPVKSKIEKEKNVLLNKIRRLVSNVDFIDFIEVGSSEQIVVRCSINENNQVVVSKVIGFDEDLKKAIHKILDKKVIMASSDLVGEELALQFKFAMQ